MLSPEIKEFAKLLIEHVRDRSIGQCDGVLDAQHVKAKKWRKAARFGNLKSIANVLIPDVVDYTIFYLLDAIDNGLIELTFKSSNGKVIDLTKDGHKGLAGWHAGSDGFREMFSKERFIDYCSDPNSPGKMVIPDQKTF